MLRNNEVETVAANRGALPECQQPKPSDQAAPMEASAQNMGQVATASADAPLAPPAQASVPASARTKTDDEVIQDIRATNQRGIYDALMTGVSSLWNDTKMAIMTLLGIIACYTQDADQIDRIVRRGAIVPMWWDEVLERDGRRSQWSNARYYITKAIATCKITVMTIFGPRRLADYCPEENPKYSLDDIGNSRLFCDLYYMTLRYCTDQDSWYYYTGTVWTADDGVAMEYCKAYVSALEDYAKRIAAINMMAFPLKDQEKKEKIAQKDPYVKHTIRGKSRRVRETILKDAKSVYGMAVALSDFDQDPYLYNCANGTLNLRDYSFSAHSPQDMITKMAAVTYDPDARSQLWDSHIATIMDNDVDKANFLQKSIGYALTGTNKYACMMILYGPKSRNGKSCTMDTINTMMGDYGASANPESLAQKTYANGSAHSDDLARLVGKRFLSVPEAENTMTLSSSLLKRCTGDGEITVRPIYKSQFTYTPQFKVFVHTNHLPRINDLSMFDSNRVKVIPFTHYFEEKDRNPDMVAELTTPENLSAVLNWALEGLKMLESEGFEPPKSVLDATEEYHQASDQIGIFLQENLEQGTGNAPTRTVYDMYKLWCESTGLRPGREQDFRRAMEARGIAVGRPRINGKQVTAYLGWSLVT